MNKAIIIATAYARSYNDTLKAFKEDQINYVKRLSRSKVTCEQLKEIIEMHHNEQIKLSNAIPTFVDIGPFRLLTETVRTTAMKKHEQLADAVLEYFYEQLRQKMENINDDFLVLMDNIEQKTGNIEDLLEKKTWCRIVPKKIEQLCLGVNRLRHDCELIASFNRNMNDDDFQTYWKIQELPQKTMNILTRRLLEFEDEKETHRENLELDQLKLQTGIINLEDEIKNFQAESDISKAIRTAANVRKVRKTLNTYEEYAQLYNKREKLFGQAITDYNELKRISDLLIPYELFWLSTVEFQKYRERELSEQLTMEPDQLREAIMEFKTNLEKCLNFFTPEINSGIHNAVLIVIREIDDFIINRLND